MAVESGPFPQSALEANRVGRLTDTQGKRLRAEARGVRKSELQVGAFLVVFGIFLFVAVSCGSSSCRSAGTW